MKLALVLKALESRKSVKQTVSHTGHYDVAGGQCLTLRENTERPITVSMGTNVLVGSDPDKLRIELLNVLEGRSQEEEMYRPFKMGMPQTI